MAIISLTTLPSRLPKIQTTINSLAKQGLPIHLFIPKRVHRLNQKFNGHVPPKIQNKVEVHVVEDLGPITKLIPGFNIDDVVITADDDMIYPDGWGKGLLNAFNQNPKAVYCYRGRIFKPGIKRYQKTTLIRYKEKPRKVDIVTGVYGAIYHKDFFPERFFERPDSRMSHVDDIWISGHLAEENIPRYSIPCPGKVRKGDTYNIDDLFSINFQRKHYNNNYAIEKFKWHGK